MFSALSKYNLQVNLIYDNIRSPLTLNQDNIFLPIRVQPFRGGKKKISTSNHAVQNTESHNSY